MRCRKCPDLGKQGAQILILLCCGWDQWGCTLIHLFFEGKGPGGIVKERDPQVPQLMRVQQSSTDEKTRSKAWRSHEFAWAYNPGQKYWDTCTFSLKIVPLRFPPVPASSKRNLGRKNEYLLLEILRSDLSSIWPFVKVMLVVSKHRCTVVLTVLNQIQRKCKEPHSN